MQGNEVIRASSAESQQNQGMATSENDRLQRLFGKRLAKFRSQHFKSARQFALHVGIEPPTYRKYERGDSFPALDVLTRICRHLGITINDLVPIELIVQQPSKKRA